MKKVDIIVPCYNEEDMIDMFYRETVKIVNTIENYSFRFIFADDGSRDRTYQKLIQLAKEHKEVKFLSFSRNFGKEAAMYAGLSYSTGDYVIIMDADLQHPPALIPDMIKGIEEGYDCCAARRSTRKGESKIRSVFSRMFYNLSNRFTDVDLVQGAVDFRIMTRQMVDSVLSLAERQRFSKGIFAWVGFQTKWIPYENVERIAGESKWSFKGLFNYAISGITAFSVTPLRMASVIGIAVMFIAFTYALFVFVSALSSDSAKTGYASIIIIMLFLGGMIIFLLGVIGEYLSKIYIEVKGRPAYIIKETSLEIND